MHRPNISKDLDDLELEWEDCASCDLGIHRQAVGGSFVFGEGDKGGILFVGEGPGATEERKGRPFVGRSGQVFRNVIENVGLSQYYLTNTVCCRSCVQATDAVGNLLFNYHNGKETPRFKDRPPLKPHLNACSARLHEQIYLIDPVVIVALGAKAVEALTGRPISITKERGVTREVEIPGVWEVPVLTEKKKVWARKHKGVIHCPTRQNTIRYLLLPTLRPSYVSQKLEDKGHRSPLRQFAKDIKTAEDIRVKYLQEVGVEDEEEE
jgi:uracil-DNA glycosylase